LQGWGGDRGKEKDLTCSGFRKGERVGFQRERTLPPPLKKRITLTRRIGKTNGSRKKKPKNKLFSRQEWWGDKEEQLREEKISRQVTTILAKRKGEYK